MDEETARLENITTTSYVDARQAARILGVNQRAIRNLSGQGQLETKTERGDATGRLMISVASLERLRRERQQSARTANNEV